MKDTSWNLSGFSAALKEQSERNELARVEAEKARGEPALFLPSYDEEMAAKGHGEGYWTNGEVIAGFRKYSNGYEVRPFVQYEVKFLRQLIALVEVAK